MWGVDVEVPNLKERVGLPCILSMRYGRQQEDRDSVLRLPCFHRCHAGGRAGGTVTVLFLTNTLQWLTTTLFAFPPRAVPKYTKEWQAIS